MTTIIKQNENIFFHPGYYIKEIIDDSGLTLEEFAKKRLARNSKYFPLLWKSGKFSSKIHGKVSKHLNQRKFFLSWSYYLLKEIIFVKYSC